jgi:hypothetical protein
MTNEQETTKFLKFPFLFDENKLLNDLATILNSNWIPHFNTAGYNGNWKVISLYSESGSSSNIFALPNNETPIIKETPVLKQCHCFKETIDFFKFPILSARILKLEPGAEIKPHKDHELGYEDGNFRLHIPITTNDNVNFTLDNKRLKMLPGECWYTNVNYTHSVSNNGEVDRIHLVIDGKRNDWSDELFFSLAPKESFSKPENSYSLETLKRIIEELKRNNLPYSKGLINELKDKLNSF